MAQDSGKNYVLGKGKVFFDRFANNIAVAATTRGEGERFLGNAPEFATSSTSETLDHYQSTGGIRVKDASVQLQLDRTGRVTVDNISLENLALLFLGENNTVTQASATAQTDALADVKLGRYYQIGVSEAAPAGLRGLTNVVVNIGGTPVTAAGNYELELDLGRIWIESDATDIAEGDDLDITFDLTATTRDQVISGSNAIYGAIRFIADNGYGENKDYYFPYVKLAPDGDYSLIGDDWQTMGFTFDILVKADGIPSAIIDGRPVATP